MKCKALFIAVVALFALMPPASATGPGHHRAPFPGIITDQTGGALPGATVLVRNVDTSVTRTLTTDGEGRYRAQALEPGTYEVSRRAARLPDDPPRRHSAEPRARTSTVNVTLGVGKIEDVVTVTPRSAGHRHDALLGRSPRRRAADSRAAAERPGLLPAGAAAARRARVAHDLALGRSRHGHAGGRSPAPGPTRSATCSTAPT